MSETPGTAGPPPPGSTDQPESAAPTDMRSSARALAGVPIGWRDVLCIGPIVLMSLYSLALSVLAPQLVARHALLVEFLRGGVSSIIVAASQAARGDYPLWLVIIAPIIALDFVDPFFYWAGRRYGRRLITWYTNTNPGLRRPLARAERLFTRYGAWTIVVAYLVPAVPNALLYVFAGEVGMPFLVFLAADLAGTLIWIGLFTTLGYHLGMRAQTVADTVASYGFKGSIALLVLFVGWTAFRNSRARRAE